MLKNILFFKIGATWNQDLTAALLALEPARFIECTPTQEKSIGLVEPRGEKNGPLIESIGGQWILKLMTQSKVLPGAVVKEVVAEKIAAIEEERGRKPGKKEKAEITENVRHELLTQAFTKKSAATIWIDPKARLLVIEASSQNKADETITTLVKVFTDFAVAPVSTIQSPSAAMAAWLNTQEMPSGFTADRDCVLKASDDSKATVRYAKHALDIAEVQAHIAAGKMPTQLAVTWDSKVSFVLMDTGCVKKLEFLDAAFDGRSPEEREKGFDADAAIVTGLLAKMIPDLVDALGGEHEIAGVQLT